MDQILTSLIYPDPVMIIGFIVILGLDLVTGIIKASKKREATTSKGLRGTIDKAYTYCALLLSLVVIFNLTSFTSPEYIWLFNYSINSIVIFSIWIEFKSILENLIAINTDRHGIRNFLCEYLLVKIHNLIIFKFKG
jgi:hypothetical protein